MTQKETPEPTDLGVSFLLEQVSWVNKRPLYGGTKKLGKNVGRPNDLHSMSVRQGHYPHNVILLEEFYASVDKHSVLKFSSS